MEYRFVKALIIIIICALTPSIVFAEMEYKEIYELESVPVEEEHIENLTEDDRIEPTADLSIPDSVMLSLDINDKGELLVCFAEKIIVFDENFKPIKAYMIYSFAYGIYFEKGGRPFAIWNEDSNNIVYMSGNGYELNEKGLVIREYRDAEYSIDKKVKSKWNRKIYELQNRTHLPQIKSKNNKTYSTLIMTDEKGTEVILCDSLRKQYLGQIWEYLWIIPVVAGLVAIITSKRKKAKRRQMQYGNIHIAELHKRVRVKRRPVKVRIKNRKL